MTEHDPLETELAALRPREPSAELKQCIANRLAARSMGPTIRRQQLAWTGAALIGGVLAASVAAVIVWQGDDQKTQSPPVLNLEADVATAFDETFPSLWSYRSGLSRSAHTLDELLDRYTVQTLEHRAGGAPVLMLARLNSDMDSLLGEL